MPDTERNALYLAVTDLNGVSRGKRVRNDKIDILMQGGLAMPRSAVGIDIWGKDVVHNGQVFTTGDGDAFCHPVLDTAFSLPGVGQLVLARLIEADHSPFPGCPVAILEHAVNRLAALGLKAVVACELEFYLQVDPQNPDQRVDLLSIDALVEKQAFFDEFYQCSEAASIGADAAISEGGYGQFELNLNHQDDPIKAATQAVMFKQLIKALAPKHGLSASFMAKPFGDQSGSGLHIHCSLINAAGENVFDDGGESGTALLRHAIAGVIDSLLSDQLILAPHQNSYRRLRPYAHAPTALAWGYDNRTVAIRVPGGAPSARRIEHRVAGADSNPYLVMASLCNAIAAGIEQKSTADEPLSGDAYAADVPQLAATWSQAIDQFIKYESRHQQSFGKVFHTMYAGLKQQEHDHMMNIVDRFEFNTYWGSV